MSPKSDGLVWSGHTLATFPKSAHVRLVGRVDAKGAAAVFLLQFNGTTFVRCKEKGTLLNLAVDRGWIVEDMGVSGQATAEELAMI